MRSLMNALKKDNLPFGIHIAARVANAALQEGVAPPSVILQNLFILQKMDNFPENLETHWFSTRKTNQSLEFSIQKRIMNIMEELKKPAVDKKLILENQLQDGWVKKIAPKVAPITRKTPAFKKPKLAVKKVDVPVPVVVIKKTKKLG